MKKHVQYRPPRTMLSKRKQTSFPSMTFRDNLLLDGKNTPGESFYFVFLVHIILLYDNWFAVMVDSFSHWFLGGATSNFRFCLSFDSGFYFNYRLSFLLMIRLDFIVKLSDSFLVLIQVSIWLTNIIQMQHFFFFSEINDLELLLEFGGFR